MSYHKSCERLLWNGTKLELEGELDGELEALGFLFLVGS